MLISVGLTAQCIIISGLKTMRVSPSCIAEAYTDKYIQIDYTLLPVRLKSCILNQKCLDVLASVVTIMGGFAHYPPMSARMEVSCTARRQCAAKYHCSDCLIFARME